VKITICAMILLSLSGCDKQTDAQRAASKQLRDGSNIITTPAKNWTFDGAPSQPSNDAK
jgi:hypothetical protein